MISALDIAGALGRPAPTGQQRAVIEADLEPALVVAGAGSGKTETMASRVLWLLANGLVSADQVLGLTFTRKAAGELATRIRDRIAALAERGLLTGGYDAFAPPTVSTYNSFSNRIFRANAALLGREADGAVLGEASAWQLARRVVVASGDARLPGLGRSVDQLTKDVLTLGRAMTENLVDPESVGEFAERFRAVLDLPTGGRGSYPEVDRLVADVDALPVLVDLAARYDEAKARRGVVEYSDQVALALRLVRDQPAIVADHREAFRVVLLDEYQDTSVVQTWLLSAIFAAHPVMAVGDPHQSIYGWRGASAANLAAFSGQFAGGTAATFSLSTSWRNGYRILDAANSVVRPLVNSARVEVARLEPSPMASAFDVEARFEQDIEREADAAATWLAIMLTTSEEWLPSSGAAEPPSAAMLFRSRSTQTIFIAAMRRHGVPYHVLGVGGLLSEPEIADLVSALRVIDDPTAGSELVRLLAGSRWRIGVRDLMALRDLARWLASRDYAQRPLDDDLRSALRDSVADSDGGSVVEALDFLVGAPDGHSALGGFGEVGLVRLREAGRMLAAFRSRAGLDLVDLVVSVEHGLALDIEVAANESTTGGLSAFDAFYSALGDYVSVDDGASLGGFLSWLSEAESRDNLAPRPEEPEPGTVQLMTIHGSKGLERDIVVVPRVVEGELPSTPREGYTGWLRRGALPWPFRGDASELPMFAWDSASSRKELLAARADFVDAVRAHHDEEERRLAYVAVTRARHRLLLTGSYWANQSSPRGPGAVLIELEREGVIATLPEREDDENPRGSEPETFLWPRDPLGGRRRAVEWAADTVRAATPSAAGRWARDLELLLDERRRRDAGAATIDLPRRVPASRFKDFVSDSASVATALRRPMPERPYQATRLGTLFHSWVEKRFGAGGSAETLDALPGELDEVGDEVPNDGRLAELQHTFESSEWANQRPIEVEREIHLPFDGQIVICKIDAVYAHGDRFRIVDWKTGTAPKSAADLEEKELQLALYRLAFAEWKAIDPGRVDAAFYFVADDSTVVPERLLDRRELIERWRAALDTPDADVIAGDRPGPASPAPR